jgi:hypothetical protein
MLYQLSLSLLLLMQLLGCDPMMSCGEMLASSFLLLLLLLLLLLFYCYCCCCCFTLKRP